MRDDQHNKYGGCTILDFGLAEGPNYVAFVDADPRQSQVAVDANADLLIEDTNQTLAALGSPIQFE